MTIAPDVPMTQEADQAEAGRLVGDPARPPASPASSRSSLLVPIGGMVLLIVLAVWGLGTRGFWIDEAFSAGATQELWSTLTQTSGTMGLYYVLLTPWSWVSMDPLWLRGLSLVFAVAAVPVVWAMAVRAFDRRIALLTVLITSSSWMMVRYAQEARSYSLMLLLTALSWLALVSALREPDASRSRRWWLVYGAAVIVGPLAHGLSVLQFAGQLAWMLIGPRRTECLERVMPIVVGVVLVSGALLVGGATGVADWIPPLALSQVPDMAGAFTAPHLAAGLGLGLAIVVGAVVCVRRSRLLAGSDDRWFALVPIAWGLVPLALLLVMSVARPYFLARYLTASAPGVALLVAMAIVGSGPSTNRLRTGAALAGVVACLAVGQVALHQDRGDDWGGVASAIAADAAPGDAIFVANPTVRSAFDYAWLEESGGPHPQTPAAFSPVERIGDLRRFYVIVDPADAPKAAAEAPYRRYWVIEQDGRSLTPQADAFLRAGPVRQGFTVVSDQEFSGGLRLVLIERR